MITKNITYTNFEGKEVTETYCFSLNKMDMLRLGANNFQEKLEKIAKESDPSKMLEFLVDLLKKTVGYKSDDGTKFIKNEEFAEEFVNSDACATLIENMLTDENYVKDFIMGVVPTMTEEQKKEVEKKFLESQTKSEN